MCDGGNTFHCSASNIQSTRRSAALGDVSSSERPLYCLLLNQEVVNIILLSAFPSFPLLPPSIGKFWYWVCAAPHMLLCHGEVLMVRSPSSSLLRGTKCHWRWRPNSVNIWWVGYLLAAHLLLLLPIAFCPRYAPFMDVNIGRCTMKFSYKWDRLTNMVSLLYLSLY